MKTSTRILVAPCLLALAFLLAPRPVHTGPGTWRYLGTNWVGPQERKVVSKKFVPAHYESCSIRTTNHGEAKGRCWIDEVSEVALEGYGPVPVDITCINYVKAGMVWDESWKKGCPTNGPDI